MKRVPEPVLALCYTKHMPNSDSPKPTHKKPGRLVSLKTDTAADVFVQEAALLAPETVASFNPERPAPVVASLQSMARSGKAKSLFTIKRADSGADDLQSSTGVQAFPGKASRPEGT